MGRIGEGLGRICEERLYEWAELMRRDCESGQDC